MRNSYIYTLDGDYMQKLHFNHFYQSYFTRNRKLRMGM